MPKNDYLQTKILVLGVNGMIYSGTTLSDAKDKATSAGTVPVAIVSYLGNDAECIYGLAVALDEVAASATTMWGGFKGTHFSSPQYTTVKETAWTDMTGKSNTDVLVACDSHTGTNTSDGTTYHHYPAIYCNGYSVDVSAHTGAKNVDVSAGQWFLASAGQWEKMRLANTKLFTAESSGGCGLSGMYWTSTEYNDEGAWYVGAGGVAGINKLTNYCMVRPVLAF